MSEKELWIINYIKQQTNRSVDVLDCEFVNEYIEKFNAKDIGKFGYPKCPELSKLLGIMYRNNILNRIPFGVRSGYNQDFISYKSPKWVYSYWVK